MKSTQLLQSKAYDYLKDLSRHPFFREIRKKDVFLFHNNLRWMKDSERYAIVLGNC